MEAIIQECLIKNYEKYYRLAYGYVRNEEDAMDIVQEGACKAIMNSASLKRKEYAETWIYRIMINEALTLLRRRQVTTLPLEEAETASADSYRDLDLRRAIDALEPLDRTIVILRFFEGRKLKEIADITRENLSTVKSRLYRTLKSLNLTLTQEGWGKEKGNRYGTERQE